MTESMSAFDALLKTGRLSQPQRDDLYDLASDMAVADEALVAALVPIVLLLCSIDARLETIEASSKDRQET